MQSCVVDGQVREFNLSGADSLESMLDSLNVDLARSGRQIALLRVNGRDVADFARESSRRLDGVRSIEITTESPLDVARNIIAEGRAFIESLQSCLALTAECFTSGSDKAGRYFNEAVQGLEWFVQMIGFIEQTLKLDYSRLAMGGKPVMHYVTGLNAIFQDIVKAQEISDTVLLADILEYDLVPHLDEWKGVFAIFEEEASVYGGQ